MKALPEIPEWGKENYQTPEPFEWLYAFKDNKFVMLQLRDAIKEKAGAVGVKNFVTKWNALTAILDLACVNRPTGRKKPPEAHLWRCKG